MGSQREVRAVLVDLDDTLVDHHHSVRAALAFLREKYPVLGRVPFGDLEGEYARGLDAIHPQVVRGLIGQAESRRVRFRELFAFCGEAISELEADAAGKESRHAYIAARRLVPGALELLRELKRVVKVAVVTNSIAADQKAKVESLGLVPYIDALVVSEEVGCAKPKPEIFRTALARLGHVEEEAVMLGDAWHDDIVGARNAGIRAVWLNRHQRTCPNPLLAAEINSLEPVEAVLRILLGADR